MLISATDSTVSCHRHKLRDRHSSPLSGILLYVLLFLVVRII